MRIEQIDPNMLAAADIAPDVEWYAVPSEYFSLHGVFWDEETERFRRLPLSVAESVSEGVAHLSGNTSGGRACFITDSPYVAVHATVYGRMMNNMSWSGSGSFDLYADNRFVGLFRSTPTQGAVETLYQRPLERFRFAEGEHRMVLNFPLYSGVGKLAIGIKKGSTLRADNPYRSDIKPILYYGSSITQGASATRAGNLMQNHIVRDTAIDYINLGFSGSAKGEPQMADYLASIDCSLLVLDWDHNLTTPDGLKAVHKPLFDRFRAAHPDTPVIMISRPDFDYYSYTDQMRRVILDTYEGAREAGDENVYFIDGETIFGEENRDACITDGSHPTDIGFYRFYKALCPMIERLLLNRP